MTKSFFKNDDDKPRTDLLPPMALIEIAKVMSFGAKKYTIGNWSKEGSTYNRYYAACMRHMLQWQSGEDLDQETGLSHIAHAASNLLFLLALILLERPDTDDRLALSFKEPKQQ
jgi:hypothetical protein